MSTFRPQPPRARQGPNLDLLLEEGMRCHQDGRTARAERLYREILQAAPTHRDANYLLGVLFAQAKAYARAIPHLETAAQVAPMVALAHASLGKAYLGVGRFAEAQASLDRALQLEPRMADAWNDRGNAVRDLGRYGEALFNFRRATELDPGMVEAWINRADLLLDVGDLPGAEPLIDTVVRLAPQIAPTLALQGRAALARGDLDAAKAAFAGAAQINPKDGQVLALHAHVLGRLGRTQEAEAERARALVAAPELPERWRQRGAFLSGLSVRVQALDYFERALELAPDTLDLHRARAMELHALGRHPEAAAAAQAALALDPEDGLAHYVLSQQALGACDFAARQAIIERVSAMVAADVSNPGLSAFQQLSLSVSPAEQLACARLFSRPYNGLRRTVSPPPRADGKIRLAYASADFHNHATAFLIADLIERHDRDRFEVTAISFGPVTDDPMRKRIEKAFDRFLDASEVPNAELLAHLHKTGVDIAVDLKGHTMGHRIALFSERIAPVQVSWLGYPGTTGCDFIDYVVADSYLIPEGQDAYWSEAVVRLPDTYQPTDSKREIAARTPTRAEAGLPEDRFVFCSFNNAYKITPDVFDVWMRLLRAVEGSVLWLYSGDPTARANLRREAEARGVAAERLIFAETVPQAEHLARQKLADLFVDTAPVNAHTTASDALYVGLPLVTLSTPVFIGRVAGSVLRAAGLPELITDNLADYEALALRLARNPAELAAVRAKLEAARTASALFDTDRFRRNLEAAYATMHERRVAGLPPQAFTVQPEP